MGFGFEPMMGSASAWRSYGFTQGSMLPQADRVNSSARDINRREPWVRELAWVTSLDLTL